MKTSELIGPALDWAVAKCEGMDPQCGKNMDGSVWQDDFPRYSTNWAQGGPIIERENISTTNPFGHHQGAGWCAGRRTNNYQVCGPTALIAAMRCYVASKLGDEVEIPPELLT